ncbi:hypothetical protein Bca4012_075080 [Brassica carinata]
MDESTNKVMKLFLLLLRGSIVSDKIDCNNVGSGMEGYIDIRPGGYWSKIKVQELNDNTLLGGWWSRDTTRPLLLIQGSDMGGRILEITSYPFEDNHLDHVFPPCNPSDDIRQRTLKITGFDTSLDEDDIDKMLLEFFPESGIMDICNGFVLLVISGLDTMDKALKLSGRTVRGSKFAVTTVLPIKLVRCGLSRAARLALGKKA